jgi:hypothetical protein
MAGRATHGGTSFQGDPAQELYEELLDSLNYVCQMRLVGMDTSDWGSRLFALTEEVQAKYAIRQEPARAAGGR